jgi:hypothetical protein
MRHSARTGASVRTNRTPSASASSTLNPLDAAASVYAFFRVPYIGVPAGGVPGGVWHPDERGDRFAGPGLSQLPRAASPSFAAVAACPLGLELSTPFAIVPSFDRSPPSSHTDKASRASDGGVRPFNLARRSRVVSNREGTRSATLPDRSPSRYSGTLSATRASVFMARILPYLVGRYATQAKHVEHSATRQEDGSNAHKRENRSTEGTRPASAAIQAACTARKPYAARSADHRPHPKGCRRASRSAWYQDRSAPVTRQRQDPRRSCPRYTRADAHR